MRYIPDASVGDRQVIVIRDVSVLPAGRAHRNSVDQSLSSATVVHSLPVRRCTSR